MSTSAVPPRLSPASRRWITTLLVLALVFVLFSLPGSAVFPAGPWLWLPLFVWFLLVWTLLASPAAAEREEVPGPVMLSPEEQPAVVREVMEVQLAERERGVQVFRGRLRGPAAAAFERLKSALAPDAVPLLQHDNRCDAAIIVLPRRVERAALERPRRSWLHWVLFLLTLLTTTWAGAAQQGVNLLAEPARFAVGLPYSLALLAILGVHELGHYFTARHHRMNVTPPYFVPVPFALGTFGAFIQMRSPAEDRRSLFDVAVAGPLAGLVVAIPALLLGLRTSSVLQTGAPPGLLHGTAVGSSLLFAALAHLAFGHGIHWGEAVRLSPLAFAGWLGLFITGLNLLPIGQLDGGHIARAMLGSRGGGIVSGIAMWSLLLLAIFAWPGLLVWALLVFFVAGRGTPPLNDLTPLGAGRIALGCLAFLVLLLVLVPVPAALSGALGMHSPYF